jgi:hypothetical protein
LRLLCARNAHARAQSHRTGSNGLTHVIYVIYVPRHHATSQTFEVFLETLERMGTSRPLRSCVTALRSREVHGLRFEESIGADGDGADADAGAGGGWAAAAAARDLARGDGDGMAGGAGGGGGKRVMTEEERMIAEQEEEDEDEELLRQMGE